MRFEIDQPPRARIVQWTGGAASNPTARKSRTVTITNITSN
jgi:hypothetical protein